ncbi:HXXEE domain-containing protein [Capnocytophaga sp.]|uniref:HXXEE domain-containing protein n=1 Tax=Capnocytophaga sp. TaxID=44737 RepID=UPI0026DC4898|nr:HXXEE domain-containing protein [Capnocytophaga sp.]MDO5104995.1 HXXEE domain-containing protein [Capnocytophaga sp.]
MTELQLLMALLPVVFMIHDFEEIVMFEAWLSKNRNKLKQRFPKFEAFLTRNGLFAYSTADFAVAVAHEFVLLSVVCYGAMMTENYGWWFAAFMAFFIHLLVYIGQWVAYGAYIPMIITTLLSIPYCGYTFFVFLKADLLSVTQVWWWTIIGLALMVLSFPLAFFWASKFQKFRKSRF